MKIDEYTEKEFEFAFKKVYRRLTRSKQIVSRSRAVLLGGQSGAGKSALHRIKQKEFLGNIIIIDGDSFRGNHPRYKLLQETYGKDNVNYTKAFAGQMVERLVDVLSRDGYNLLIEGTLRTTEVPKKTAQLLKERGYEVSLAVVATKPELSYLSTLVRYEATFSKDPGQARATPKEHHDGIVEHLVDNLRELEESAIFDQIELYQRYRVRIYPREGRKIRAYQVLQEVLFGEWTITERDMYKASLEDLERLCLENGHPLDADLL